MLKPQCCKWCPSTGETSTVSYQHSHLWGRRVHLAFHICIGQSISLSCCNLMLSDRQFQFAKQTFFLSCVSCKTLFLARFLSFLEFAGHIRSLRSNLTKRDSSHKPSEAVLLYERWILIYACLCLIYGQPEATRDKAETCFKTHAVVASPLTIVGQKQKGGGEGDVCRPCELRNGCYIDISLAQIYCKYILTYLRTYAG